MNSSELLLNAISAYCEELYLILQNICKSFEDKWRVLQSNRMKKQNSLLFDSFVVLPPHNYIFSIFIWQGNKNSQ